MTITIEAQTRANVNAAQWDDWMIGHDAAEYQHYAEYGAAMEQTAASARYLRFLEGPKEVARAIMMVQKLGPIGFKHFPRGLVFADIAAMPDVFAAVRGLAPGWRGGFVFLSPSGPEQASAIGKPPVMSGESDAVLEIEAADAVQRARMHQKWRNRLHKAEGSVLDIRQVKPSHPMALWLMQQEALQRKAKGYRALPATLPADMAREKGRSEALFVVACASGLPVSGASFIVCGQHATYFSGVTTAQGRDLCAQHLVLHTSVQALRQRGIQSLNLGLLDTEKNQGLSRFKIGLGARPVQRPGLYLLA